ncbi:MAG: hypothetical protein WC323_03440 [Patescibacteria group bacterium]|jgi:hypothetical protein
MRQKPYDKNKIGKFIGWGGEHLVFKYGDKHVIKFSLHVWLSGKSAVDKKIKDYEVGKKYFNEYLLPVEILTWKKGKRAVEIQEKIQARFLTKKDLDDALTKHQFNDIMERYQRMEIDAGEIFDLFGREGLFKLKPDFISNILITPNNRLVLNDFTILKLEKVKIREIFIWIIIEWAKRRQSKLLKRFRNIK